MYIFWFLHQTTTVHTTERGVASLYIFWFLHQTTTFGNVARDSFCCISFDSYIKPQREIPCRQRREVVYLLIPTSNHNFRYSAALVSVLYIFWFLHQTTTSLRRYQLRTRCISFDSYIKPQLTWNVVKLLKSCISFDSYIKPQPITIKCQRTNIL